MFNILNKLFSAKKQKEVKQVPISDIDIFRHIQKVVSSRSEPLWPKHKQLLEIVSRTNNDELISQCMALSNKIEDIFIDIQERAKRFEKNGDIEKAIMLYEQCVTDKFDGSNPYERLQIIYKGQQENQKLIAVCEAYIHQGNDEKLRTKYIDFIAKLNKT